MKKVGILFAAMLTLTACASLSPQQAVSTFELGTACYSEASTLKGKALSVAAQLSVDPTCQQAITAALQAGVAATTPVTVTTSMPAK